MALYHKERLFLASVMCRVTTTPWHQEGLQPMQLPHGQRCVMLRLLEWLDPTVNGKGVESVVSDFLNLVILDSCCYCVTFQMLCNFSVWLWAGYRSSKYGSCSVTGHKEWKLIFCSDIALVDIYLFVTEVNESCFWRETMSVQYVTFCHITSHYLCNDLMWMKDVL